MTSREFHLHNGQKGSALAIRVTTRARRNEIVEVLSDGTAIITYSLRKEYTNEYHLFQSIISADQMISGNITDIATSRLIDPLAVTDKSRTLHYDYDLNNRLTTFTDADGNITTFEYDAANNKISETIHDSNDEINPARQTSYDYDLNNRLIRQAFDPGEDEEHPVEGQKQRWHPPVDVCSGDPPHSGQNQEHRCHR